MFRTVPVMTTTSSTRARKRTSAAASVSPCHAGLPFAVIDLETTGFSAQTQRIVEVAVDLLDPAGEHQGRYETLIDSGCGAGPTHVHQIADQDLIGAPAFADIAGDLFDHLAGRVIVAHNATFEEQFLTAEYARAGLQLPALPLLCTYRSGLVTGANLATATASYGIPLTGAHTAGGDVTATSELLRVGLYRCRIDRAHATAWPAGVTVLDAGLGAHLARTGRTRPRR